MNIPMVDLKQQYLELKQEIDDGLQAALESTQFILGPNVQAFEKEAAEYLGVKHCLGVNSGTDALHLALIAAGVGKGDEVITTTFTFIATAEAISYVGATPVFVDVDPKTFNMDLGQVRKNINSKTKAIIPVHLFGQPVNMPELVELSQLHNIKIVEDCAQSFGADINGKQTGSFGDIGAFSFFPSKNLGCFGDGGLISTNSDEIFEHLNVLRNHGMSVRYHHTEIGYNSRLDELQAVILRVKLKHIDRFNDNRRRVDSLYKTFLAETDVVTPFEDKTGKHVYHQYTCLHPKRDQIMQALQQAKIACAIYYPIPLHRQDVYQEQFKNLSLPNAESIVEKCFSLPIYPELTEEKIQQVCEVIKTAI
ncbi:DegT/DnrJ/EryC1/StrS family aminotransferase [Aliikangiella coralliicola]|uniref:DegT/DnrJ/EryC1/StrS aminotransferase family protein n=1 Tax=Aliikangiella coralliicola TaxID=2592383 RepID=A0A545UAZ0_9GAMM|nr:DegT/DnrJ/EryC1/StrS aminotransferase family protein [Aliikangiella coralliicola]TQV86630.1 DegT/DnrJ/EryC1/StrS aminotransferase family protein [Aliikangiella coralliicola]